MERRHVKAATPSSSRHQPQHLFWAMVRDVFLMAILGGCCEDRGDECWMPSAHSKGFYQLLPLS
jgi:hypothetical protein